MNTSDMTKDEMSCILYLETCAVDQGGLVEGIRMNAADYAACKKFVELNLIEFRRIPAALLGTFARQVTDMVTFKPGGWVLAHRLRQERAERGLTQHARKRVNEHIEAHA